MPSKLIQNPTIESIEKGPIKVKTLHQDSILSIAEIELDGENIEVRNMASDSIYYIVSGSGRFFINGIYYLVKTGDCIVISKGDRYYDQGKMKLLCINRPPFNPDSIQES